MPQSSRGNPELYRRVASGLGWFSIGLGLAQIFAPRRMARLAGVKADLNLLRLLGAREFITGVGILSQKQPASWVHARVAGDALDLALLSTAITSSKTRRSRVAAATAAVAGVTALDMLCGIELSRHPAPKSIRLSRSITINSNAEELYSRWRNLEDLPDYMSHLQHVFVTGEKTSHWVAKAPAGMKVEWDAEIIEDRPNEYLAWRTLPGATVENSGSITFEPATGNRGTILRVEMEYVPPAGHLGAVLARVLGKDPHKQIAVDLLRFKQRIETGEIARTEGQPAGRKRSTSRLFDAMVRA
jgi:uncharacterized membrane protein